MIQKDIKVTKASGLTDEYSSEKLRRSLAKSGAGSEVIETILGKIESTIYNGISTKKIYKTAFDLLRKNKGRYAGRYNLKRAIMELGPSGFPFEQYIAAIFQWQGYKVKLKQFLTGLCVTHEIDVLAENDLQVLVVECKYHNSQGVFSDVKIPLYIHSRFRDVETSWAKQSGAKPLQGWLVTNTRFTADAIKYGDCAGLHLLGWNYPDQKNLYTLVDESGLYPITCITGLSRKEKQQLLEAGLLLCSELEHHETVLLKIGISKIRIPNILTEAGVLSK